MPSANALIIEKNAIYGQWVVIEPNVINPNTTSKNYKNRTAYSLCKCKQCNETTRYILNNELKKYALMNSPCKACTQRNRAEANRKIKIGDVFTKLTVIGDGGYSNQRHYSLCQCECGNIVRIKDNALLTKNTKSCGCITSAGEMKIIQILKDNNYIYSHDCILPEFLKETGKKYRFDFIIYNEDGTIKCIIEFDGRQHFFGPDTSYWGHSTMSLEDIQDHDSIKNNFCIQHNIPLYRIPYTKINTLNHTLLFDDDFLIKGDVEK